MNQPGGSSRAPVPPQVVDTLRGAMDAAVELESEAVLNEQLQAATSEAERAAEVARKLVEAYPSCEAQVRAILMPLNAGTVL